MISQKKCNESVSDDKGKFGITPKKHGTRLYDTDFGV